MADTDADTDHAIELVQLRDEELAAFMAPPRSKFIGEVGICFATARGFVCAGEPDGHFDAWDAKTGALLWQFQTGSGIHATRAAYRVPTGPSPSWPMPPSRWSRFGATCD